MATYVRRNHEAVGRRSASPAAVPRHRRSPAFPHRRLDAGCVRVPRPGDGRPRLRPDQTLRSRRCLPPRPPRSLRTGPPERPRPVPQVRRLPHRVRGRPRRRRGRDVATTARNPPTALYARQPRRLRRRDGRSDPPPKPRLGGGHPDRPRPPDQPVEPRRAFRDAVRSRTRTRRRRRIRSRPGFRRPLASDSNGGSDGYRPSPPSCSTPRATTRRPTRPTPTTSSLCSSVSARPASGARR